MAFVAAFAALDAGAGHASTLILYPPFYWAAFVLASRRLHDRGRSARWLLALLVPILGPLWMALQLALLPGTPARNAFGPDPRRRLNAESAR